MPIDYIDGYIYIYIYTHTQDSARKNERFHPYLKLC